MRANKMGARLTPRRNPWDRTAPLGGARGSGRASRLKLLRMREGRKTRAKKRAKANERREALRGKERERRKAEAARPTRRERWDIANKKRLKNRKQGTKAGQKNAGLVVY